MEVEEETPRITTTRHKCSACYKQYKKKEHLVEHMKKSYHSLHQPKCGVCKKYCKSFESLKEHIIGPLAKTGCAEIFNALGCDLCLNVFRSSDAFIAHKEACHLSPPPPFEFVKIPSIDFEMETLNSHEGDSSSQGPEVVAIDCEMVGAGSDGTLNVCGRVCLIDEEENVIFHTYVIPQIPVTDYRFEITGMTEEKFRDAMPLKEVGEKIKTILSNGEDIWKIRLDGGKARLLVGHNVDHDLACLKIDYPQHLMRDTAKYRPLMKTNEKSHALKYLTKTYLGYDIQTGIHDPYEDCVAAMRLYKRMRGQVHPVEETPAPIFLTNTFNSWTPKELESMSPDALFEISRSDYNCWCLDSRPKT